MDLACMACMEGTCPKLGRKRSNKNKCSPRSSQEKSERKVATRQKDLSLQEKSLLQLQRRVVDQYHLVLEAYSELQSRCILGCHCIAWFRK